MRAELRESGADESDIRPGDDELLVVRDEHRAGSTMTATGSSAPEMATTATGSVPSVVRAMWTEPTQTPGPAAARAVSAPVSTSQSPGRTANGSGSVPSTGAGPSSPLPP